MPDRYDPPDGVADPSIADLGGRLGSAVVAAKRLAGGDVADTRALVLADGRRLVAKLAPRGGLAIEAFMLRYLARHAPVPAVVLGDDTVLVLEMIENDGRVTAAAQADLADRAAGLHAVRGPSFGFERDTVIGPLPQANPETPRWLPFFRDARLLPMADAAESAGALPPGCRARLDRLAGRLDGLVEEPAHPALLHGDLWGGNVLWRGGRVAALIDPALYHGHPEMDLAFLTLFGSVSEPFFRRYAEHYPIAPGFFERRRDLYNLWPLLVHARLFGAAYGRRADDICRALLA